MANKHFSWKNLFSDEFQSGEIDIEELENIVRDAIARECHSDDVTDINYNKDGLEVILKSGNIVEIEVDWNEIILT